MIKYYLKTGLNLAIICAVAAAGLSLTYSLTKDAITRQDLMKQEKANKAVMPSASAFKEVDTKLPSMQTVTINKVFKAMEGSNTIGFVAQLQTKGYGGLMQMAVGVDGDGKVSGVSIINDNETPGLGKKIEDVAWLSKFKGKTTSDPWQLKKDIDGFAGASISPGAVVKATHFALRFIDKGKSGW